MYRGTSLIRKRPPPRTTIHAADPAAVRIVYRLLGPVDPLFRALYGRLKFTVRRHKFNKLFAGGDDVGGAHGQHPAPDPQTLTLSERESSFLTTYWSESTLSS